MKPNNNNLIPFKAIHPGEIIKDELEAIDMTQKELAILLGVKSSYINEIIKGKRNITAEIAVLLENVFKIPAMHWMSYQSQYDIDLQRIKERNIKRASLIPLWGVVKQYVSVKSLQKLGYLKDDLEYNYNTIKEIFGVNSVDELVSFFTKKRQSLDELNEEEKNTMDLNEYNMVVNVASTTYLSDGRPFQYGSISYRPDKIAFTSIAKRHAS